MENATAPARRAKTRTAIRAVLIVAFLGVTGLIVGSISRQANAPASGATAGPTASTPPAPQRAVPPARQQFHRRLAFRHCINDAADMADAIGIAPTVSQSSSGNAVSARFEFPDGAVIITCHRAEGVMTVERR